MGEIRLTVSQVADEIGEKAHTVRNWLRDYRQYIPLEKAPNGYNLFTQNSINVLREIQRMSREQNLTARQIERILAGESMPTAAAPEVAAATQTDIDDIKEALKQQQEFNKVLLSRLEEQQQYIEKMIDQRDRQLMTFLKEVREQQKLLTAGRSRWKFWKGRKK